MSTLPGDAPSKLIHALKDRYTIKRLIGSGASSKVFLAEDDKHGRSVAIKVLHSDLSASVGAQRFSREIRVAARLSHPHILSVFDSGEIDGLLWYVMPFVDGESVRDRLNRETQLPIDDVVSITRNIADALAYAHEQGVIHRDVKPENILLTRMHALIADFGIAKATDSRLTTEAGMALGTPAYMSPEQASGESVIDGRSDVYAMGCLMYEMLAGRPAFSGKSIPIILTQVMTMTPQPIGSLRSGIPDQLQAAVEISMAKDPDERFQNAGQLADALRWAGTPPSVPVIRMITPDPVSNPLTAVPTPQSGPAVPAPAVGVPQTAPIAAQLAAPIAAPIATPQSTPLSAPIPVATPPRASAPIPPPPVIGVMMPSPASVPAQSPLFAPHSPPPVAPPLRPAPSGVAHASTRGPSKLAITLIGLVFVLVILLVILLFKNS